MTRYRHAQNNFNGGELGERLYGRTDLEQYRDGAKKLDGFLPLRQGGARTMPNTRILGLNIQHVFPWNKTSTMSDGGVFFYDNNEVKWKFGALNNISAATDVVFRKHTAPYSDLNAFEIGTPDPYDVHIVQSGDVMIMTWKDGTFAPHIAIQDPVSLQLEIFPWDYAYAYTYRTGQLGVPATFATYPYSDRNTTAITLTITALGPRAKITASQSIFTEDEEYYLGKFFKLNYVTTTEVFQVYSKISDTELEVFDAIAATTAHPATDDWQITLFGGTDNPTSVTLHEGRLILGGQSRDKLEVTGSMSNNLFFFMEQRLLQAVDKASDVAGLNYYGDKAIQDPYRFTVTSHTANNVAFLFGGRALFVGSDAGVHALSGGESVIAYNNISSDKFSGLICSNVQPVDVDQAFLFADTSGRIHSMNYAFESDGYATKELTALYEPITDIRYMTYDRINSVLWATSASNTESAKGLHGVVFAPTVGVSAWVHYKYFQDADVISGGDGSTILNTVGYELLQMDSQYVPQSFRLNHVDTALSHISTGVVNSPYYASKTATVWNIDTDTIVGDVAFDGSGNATLDPDTVYAIGTKSTARIETLPIVTASAAGSGDAALSRIDRVTPRFIGTTGGKMGTREDFLNTIFALSDEQPFSGPKQISLDCGQELDNVVIIETDEPYPMEISSLVFRGQVFE